MLGQRVLPLSRVGVYAPGGRALYPSSVLMDAIRAGGGRTGDYTVPRPGLTAAMGARRAAPASPGRQGIPGRGAQAIGAM